MYYISLAEAFNPSIADPGKTYPKLFISWLHVDMENEYYRVGLDFGNTDGSGNQSKGKCSQRITHTFSSHTDWIEFGSLMASGIMPMADQIAGYVLEKLIADDVVSGVVEYEAYQI